MDKQKSQWMIIAGVVIAVLGFSQLPPVKDFVLNQIDRHHQIKKKVLVIGAELLTHPALKAEMDQYSDEKARQRFGEGLTRQGMRRLNYEQLKQWNAIRLDMVKRSPKFCAALWKGGIRDEDILDIFVQWDDATLRQWLDLMTQGQVAEFTKQEYVPTKKEEFDVALAELRSSYSPTEQEKIDELQDSGTEISDENACWMMNYYLANERLGDDLREKFLRALASF